MGALCFALEFISSYSGYKKVEMGELAIYRRGINAKAIRYFSKIIHIRVDSNECRVYSFRTRHFCVSLFQDTTAL